MPSVGYCFKSTAACRACLARSPFFCSALTPSASRPAISVSRVRLRQSRTSSQLPGDDGGLIVTGTRAFEDIALVNPTLGGFEALTRVRQEYHPLTRSEEPHIHTIPV